jgi:uncharacterized membrane protein
VRIDQDLCLALVASGAAAGLTAVSAGPVRMSASLLLVAFLPGYALLAALYPGRTDLGRFERAALSMVTSLALAVVAGLALTGTSWGLSVVPITLSLVVPVVACSMVAWLRRGRLPVTERFAPALRTVHVVAAACCLLGLTGAGFGMSALSAVGDVTTQFYLLGPHGMMADYPTHATVGRPVEVMVGIANREPRAETYRVVLSDGVSTISAYELTAGPRSSVERRVSVTPARPGRLDVTFLLYRRGESRVRQFLRLPLTVAP